MKITVLGLSLAALLAGVVTASAQGGMMDEAPQGNQAQAGGYDYGAQGYGYGPMGYGFGPMGYGYGPMGYGQVMNGQGAGMMGFGMMGSDMMHMFLILMDANGDGALSLEEYQQAQARIFAYLDANGDGQLTADEIEAHWQNEMGDAR